MKIKYQKKYRTAELLLTVAGSTFTTDWSTFDHFDSFFCGLFVQSLNL